MMWVSRVLWLAALLGAGFAAVDWGMFYTMQIAVRSSPDVSAIQITLVASVCLVWAFLPFALATAWDRMTRRAAP